MCASQSKKDAARAAKIIKIMMKIKANTEMLVMQFFLRHGKVERSI